VIRRHRDSRTRDRRERCGGEGATFSEAYLIGLCCFPKRATIVAVDRR
jgi:hypothetical protein